MKVSHKIVLVLVFAPLFYSLTVELIGISAFMAEKPIWKRIALNSIASIGGIAFGYLIFAGKRLSRFWPALGVSFLVCVVIGVCCMLFRN